MTEVDKANEDLLLYGQSFMLNGKHIPLERVMIDMVTYEQAVIGAAAYLNETPHSRVQVAADILALIFMRTNGEVWLDLKAERYEQKKVM